MPDPRRRILLGRGVLAVVVAPDLRANRRRAASDAHRCRCNIFTATFSAATRSQAAKTMPLEPQPSRRWISYLPPTMRGGGSATSAPPISPSPIINFRMIANAFVGSQRNPSAGRFSDQTSPFSGNEPPPHRRSLPTIGGLGELTGAGASQKSMGPPARRHPVASSQVRGIATGRGSTARAIGCAHPSNQGPELHGSTRGGARRCLRKLRST